MESMKKTPSEADIALAKKLKDEGNGLMKENKASEAVSKYTEALKLHKDPIYYCNRAAAHAKLEEYVEAVGDCWMALAINPTYSKAYGRLGVAYTSLEQYEQAVDCLQKAKAHDPENAAYANNLMIAEQKLAEQQGISNNAAMDPLAGLLGRGAGTGGAFPDFGAMLGNPQIQQMAAAAMNDPQMSEVMGQMMGQLTGGSGGLDGFMTFCRQMAEQVQESNPDMVSRLREQFESAQTDESPNADQDGGSK